MFNSIQQEWREAFLLMFGAEYCNAMVHAYYPRTVLFEYGPPKPWGKKFTVENEAVAKFIAINMRLGMIAMLRTGEIYCCNEDVAAIVAELRGSYEGRAQA